MIEHSSHMKNVLQQINQFYIENALESDEIIG